MERKSLWKNFLLLTIGSLLVLHMNSGHAAEGDKADTTLTSTDASDSCVLEE